LPSRRRRCQATIPGALSGTKSVQARRYTYTTQPTPWKYLYPLFFLIVTPLQRSRSYSYICFLFNATFHDNLSTIILYSGTLHATLFPCFFCCALHSRSLFFFCIFLLFFYCFHLSSPFPYSHFNDYTASIYPLSLTLVSVPCIELFFTNLFFFFLVFFLHLDEFCYLTYIAIFNVCHRIQ